MDFIIWGKYQSRAERLASFLNCKIHYIYSEKSLLARYMDSLFQSINIIRKSQSKNFIIQLPPNILIYVVPFVKLVYKRSNIIFDLHNGATRGSWDKLPFIWNIINKYADLIIVHNDDYYNEITKSGRITSESIEVLPDPPAEKNSSIQGITNTNSKLLKQGKTNILVPCSYNPDEPISELVDLAKLNPEYHLILTGNKNKAMKILEGVSIPDNITFSGFISAEEYKYLFLNADAIMGLTKNDNIQLSVSTESLSFGKPAILSDTETLRKLYSSGYLFTTNTPENMQENIEKYLKDYKTLNEDLKEIRSKKIIDWNNKLDELRGKYKL